MGLCLEISLTHLEAVLRPIGSTYGGLDKYPRLSARREAEDDTAYSFPLADLTTIWRSEESTDRVFSASSIIPEPLVLPDL